MVIDIQKQPTWTDKITELSVGEEFMAPYNKRQTIAPLISKLKKEHKYFQRNFETTKTLFKDQEVLLITRLEDKVQ